MTEKRFHFTALVVETNRPNHTQQSGANIWIRNQLTANRYIWIGFKSGNKALPHLNICWWCRCSKPPPFLVIIELKWIRSNCAKVFSNDDKAIIRNVRTYDLFEFSANNDEIYCRWCIIISMLLAWELIVVWVRWRAMFPANCSFASFQVKFTDRYFFCCYRIIVFNFTIPLIKMARIVKQEKYDRCSLVRKFLAVDYWLPKYLCCLCFETGKCYFNALKQGFSNF